MLTFQRTGRTESPAGAALSLVFDGADISVLPPVNLSRENDKIWRQVRDSSGRFGLVVAATESVHYFAELMRFHVSEMVHFQLEGLQSTVEKFVVLSDLLAVHHVSLSTDGIEVSSVLFSWNKMQVICKTFNKKSVT